MRLTLLTVALISTMSAADLAGTWNMSADAPDGRVYKFSLTVKPGDAASVVLTSPQLGTVSGNKVVISGSELSFEIPNPNVASVAFKLKCDGDTLKGTLTTSDGDPGTVTGTREKAQSAGAEASVSPAQLPGTWNLIAKTESGREMPFILKFSLAGEKLAGSIGPDESQTIPLSGIELRGNELVFKIVADQGDYTIKGTVNGSEIKGTFKAGDAAGGTFIATRNAGR